MCFYTCFQRFLFVTYLVMFVTYKRKADPCGAKQHGTIVFTTEAQRTQRLGMFSSRENSVTSVSLW